MLLERTEKLKAGCPNSHGTYPLISSGPHTSVTTSGKLTLVILVAQIAPLLSLVLPGQGFCGFSLPCIVISLFIV